jgi:magnesium transporter
MHNVEQLNFKNFSWTLIFDPTHESTQYLKEHFQFHPLALEGSLANSKRTKMDIHSNHAYFVLSFPYYEKNKQKMTSSMVHFFVSGNFLVTIVHGKLKTIKSLFEALTQNHRIQNLFIDATPERLVYEILNKLYLESMPIIDEFIDENDKIEETIFSGKEKKMISQILISRRNIIDFRKIMQGHKDVLKKLITYLVDSPQYKLKRNEVYIHDLIDHSKEVWSHLESLKERIEALQQTNESQISFKLSDIMKMLTIISVITFPVTLIAGIFGMNTIDSMPFVQGEYGFWVVIAIMLSIVIIMLSLFKKKDWM